MMTASKQSIRPEILGIGPQDDASVEERFQNEVLRPILKLQHDVILAYFQQYLTRTKRSLVGLSGFEKKELIAGAFAKDHSLKLELRGMVLGLLTKEEFETYTTISNSMNKRIVNMLQERIQSVFL